MTTSLGRKAQIESQFGRAADMYAVSEHHTGSDLDAVIRLASDTAKEYFEIYIEGGVIESFSDDKIVVRATSPRP